MRKYVIGGLVGLAIGLSATAYANDINSLIGQKIQGQTVIYLDGTKLDTAIIVEGKSYAPTRKVAEAAGQKVTFNERGIYLETKETPIVIADPTGSGVQPPKEDKLIGINAQISNVKVQIQSIKMSLTQNISQESKDKLNASLAQLEQQLADLESQKAELEAK